MDATVMRYIAQSHTRQNTMNFILQGIRSKFEDMEGYVIDEVYYNEIKIKNEEDFTLYVIKKGEDYIYFYDRNEEGIARIDIDKLKEFNHFIKKGEVIDHPDDYVYLITKVGERLERVNYKDDHEGIIKDVVNFLLEN